MNKELGSEVWKRQVRGSGLGGRGAGNRGKGRTYRRGGQERFYKSFGWNYVYCLQGVYVMIYFGAKMIYCVRCAIFFLSSSSHELIGGDLRLGHYAHVYLTSMLSYFYTHLRLCPSFVAIPHHTHLNFVLNIRSTYFPQSTLTYANRTTPFDWITPRYREPI
jgi:hypothetical protein